MNIELLKAAVAAALSRRSVCHDYTHALHVEAVALDIAQSYPVANVAEISATALLHDVWDHKFVPDPSAVMQAFKEHLQTAGFSQAAIQRIYDNVEMLSWSKGQTPETLEGKIVQDADRITALGAVGILRAATYQANNNEAFDLTVQHLIDKCLLLKDRMNFPESRAMASAGHWFLVQFIERYKRETFF